MSLIVLLPLLVLIATDTWVYVDARAQCDRGSSVVLSIGSLRIEAPGEWVVACTIVWVLFFPLYLVGRRD